MNGAALLPEFDQEMANTRKTLERISDEQLGFRPHEKSWTLRELAGHLAQIPTWMSATLNMDEIDLAGPFPRPEFDSGADILAAFDANVADARKALEVASGEDLAKPWTARTGDEVHFTMPKIVVLRSFVFNHCIHHRGQLTVYLRMTGAPVPALYGPSADET